MREEEPNWFARWEEELPSPEELMPLSQTLITPDLALAFDIPSPTANSSSGNPSPHLRQQHHHLHPSQRTPPPPPPPPQSQSQSLSPRHNNNNSQQQQQNEFESSEGGGGAGGEEQARTLKRPRLVWTPQLHKRFVDAVAHLGIKNAVPKTIMQLMSVDGLTRENVASHLQKYRLYLKRMQGLSSAGGGPVSPADAATDHLFASAPLPHHFLNRGGPHVGPGGGGGGGGGGPDQYMPFVPVAALQHHQQMAAAAAAAAAHQQQFYHHRHGMGHIGSPPGGGFDHGFLTRQQPGGIHRMVGPPGVGVAPPQSAAGSYVDDLEPSSETGRGGRQVLTLFPTGDD